MKECPQCHNSWPYYVLTCDCGYEFPRREPVREMTTHVPDSGGCVVKWVVGVLLGVGGFVLFTALFSPLIDAFPFRLLLSDDPDLVGYVSVFLGLFAVCFVLRRINNRLKRISSIRMIAVMTFGLIPFVLFACFIWVCSGGGCGEF
jgi:hypothetical protein